MKIHKFRHAVVTASLSIAVLLSGLTVVTAAEQTHAKSHADQNAHHAHSKLGHLDDVTSGSTFRASQLMGMNIYNAQNKSLGEVQDVVIDGSGKIRYAAVTYGGFLGMGDKMFAVPWGAFKCQQAADDKDDYHLVLDINQKTLEGAQGFDQDNWPNMADRSLAEQLDKRYGVDRSRERGERQGTSVTAGYRGANTERNQPSK